MKNLNESKYMRVEMELGTSTNFFKFMDALQFLYYYGRKDTAAYV